MGCCDSKLKHPFQDEFDWGKKLGRGSFGEVFQCTRMKDDQVMACKVMQIISEDDKYFLKTELQMMEKLSGKHPAFLTIYEWRKTGDVFRLFCELCEGGDLKDIGKLPIDDFRIVLEQITSALVYLHSRRVAHLDLKPVAIINN